MGALTTAELRRWFILACGVSLLGLAGILGSASVAPAGADGAVAAGEAVDNLSCEGRGRVRRVRSLDIGEGVAPWGPTRRAAGAIGRYGYAHPGAWAEMYMWTPADAVYDPDAPRPKTWVGVSFSRNLTRHANRIAKLVPPEAPVRFFKAKSSIEELSVIQARIHQEMGGDNPSFDPGGEYWGNGIEVKRNVVEVVLDDYRRGIARAIRERYGPAVCVPD